MFINTVLITVMLVTVFQPNTDVLVIVAARLYTGRVYLQKKKPQGCTMGITGGNRCFITQVKC